jgi:type II secretory pathway component GspD/PulD (secretin)
MLKVILLSTLAGLMAVALPAMQASADMRPADAGMDDAMGRVLERVEFHDAALQDAARLLSEQTGMNIVCSADAGKTKVSIFLQDVPAHVVVEELCKANNLSYRVDATNGVISICTIEEFQRNLTSFRDQQTRVFTLLYPNAVVVAQAIHDLFGDRVKLSLGDENSDDELQDLQDRFSRFDIVDQRSQNLGGINSSGAGSGSGSGSIATSYGGNYSGESADRSYGNQNFGNNSNPQTVETSDELRQMTPEQADRIARTLEQNPGNPDLQAMLDAYRQKEASIYVTVIRRNNNIVVRTADPDTMAEISHLIDQLDVPTSLVMLEVKVLQIDLSDSFNSAFDYQFSNGSGVAAGFTTGDIFPPQSDLSSGTAQKYVSMAPGGTGLQSNNLIFQVVSDNFRARLQALQSKNKVTQLAAPLLMTANNEVSRLFVGEEEPIVQNISSQTVINNNTTTTSPNTTINFQPVGTTLLITPNINADRTVTLRILQENSQIIPDGGTIPVVTGNGTITSQPIDIVSTRTFSGTIVAKDSLTMAIGGLISEQVNDQRDQVPILGQIPGLGIFFRRQNTGRSRTEFVILIRPYILNTPSESQALGQKMMKDLSIHPNAEHFEGTMNTFSPDEVPRAKGPPASKLDGIFRFHSVDTGDY